MKTENKYQVALIGASGFIATALIRELKKSNKTVLYVGRSRPIGVPVEDFIACDLADLEPMTAELREVDTVIFNSAIKSRFDEDSPEWTQQGLITAPNFSKLFEAIKIKTTRLVTIGSSEEYGARDNESPITEDGELNPLSSYGYWKTRLYANALTWANIHGGQSIHLRPFNVFGIGLDPKMFLGSLIMTLLKNESFKMTAGEQFRSFVEVGVLTKAVHKLTALTDWRDYQKNGALNISSHSYYQLKDVSAMAYNLIKKGKLEIGVVPYRKEEVWHQKPDLQLIDKLLGSTAVNFETELKKLINYYSAI